MAIEKLLLVRRGDRALSPSEVVEVLKLLNKIGDRWHWHELLDRLPNDPRNIDG